MLELVLELAFELAHEPALEPPIQGLPSLTMPETGDAAVIDAPVPTDSAAAQHPAELDLGYRVTLDAFSGPLDLLLYLVRRAEVDIADIPISTITDQFVAAIANWEDPDLDVAGDFILMAASLLEIKSRLVVPPEVTAKKEGQDGEVEEDDFLDPRQGLIRQLLAYRRFKDATLLLAGLEAAQCARVPRQLHEIIPEDPDEADGIELANCDAGLLYTCWEKVLSRINGLGPRTVVNDDVPLEHKITVLVDAMRAAREGKLSWLFEREHSKTGRVGMLLATLECARQRFIEVLQYEQFGDVNLRYREDEERTREPGELAAEPTDEPKRRRRRAPLVTWRVPARDASQPEQQEIDLDASDSAGAAEGDDNIEEIVETDEQRFMRELEESCAVEAVLTRTADIEASFAAFVAARLAEAEAAKQPAAPVTVEATPEMTEKSADISQSTDVSATADPAPSPAT